MTRKKRTYTKPPVSGPRDTLIDADRLYKRLYCRLCIQMTQHIFCELQRYTGLGYACMECGAEQAGESAIKRDRRPKSERGLSERDLEVARRLGLIDRQEESQEACK